MRHNTVGLWFLPPYWALVIKIHYVPLGCRGQFVSSALIWQHFNPFGHKLFYLIYFYGMLKNSLPKIKKVTYDPSSLHDLFWAGLVRPYWLLVHYMHVLIWLLLFVSSLNSVTRRTGPDRTKKKKAYIFMCLLCCYFRGVWESHSCFEEKVSSFVFFRSQKDGGVFFRADAILQHLLFWPNWVLISKNAVWKLTLGFAKIYNWVSDWGLVRRNFQDFQ